MTAPASGPVPEAPDSRAESRCESPTTPKDDQVKEAMSPSGDPASGAARQPRPRCGPARRVRSKEISARELVAACIDRVKAVDGRVKAFMSYDEADALAQAAAIDGGAHDGRPLLGVPIGIKDVLSVKGHPLNCSSKILRGPIATAQPSPRN